MYARPKIQRCTVRYIGKILLKSDMTFLRKWSSRYDEKREPREIDYITKGNTSSVTVMYVI